MIDQSLEKKRNQKWYMARRGELLAEQFLLDLEPASVSSLRELDLGIDYMVFFRREDQSIIAIAVEVKAIEKTLHGQFPLSGSQARKLAAMNVPVLLVVVNVKSNDIYFNWLSETLFGENTDKETVHSIPVRLVTPEERDKLKQEILNQ